MGLCGTLFPPAGDWAPPRTFPCLVGEKVIGLDIETHDPDLSEKGPGFIRGDAKVVGISVATSDRGWYLPIRHLGGGNLPEEGVLQFVADTVSISDRYIIGANLQYELEGLGCSGIKVSGRLIDVQIAEALIDEEAESTALDTLTRKYLGSPKCENLLREAASAYGVDPKKSLWKLPSKYVGAYAEYDAWSVIKVFEKQLPILKAEKLEEVFELESKLLPLLWKMRRQGIRVDLDAASQLAMDLHNDESTLRKEFREKYGQDIDEWSGPQIAMLCDRHRILYPRTPRGNPSFTSDYMDIADHPLLMAIGQIRKVNRFRKTFVEGWILNNHINGKVHCQWKQVAQDDGGTRSGRMAASNPNPQQIPAGKFRKTGKESPIGQAIRACFIPEDGMQWAKHDYSQQEPRILVHFATICGFTGAQAAADAYKHDPDMDFYKFMMDVANIDRRPAKDMFLGRCYGMGKDKMAFKLNRSVEEAQAVLADFDAKLPFIKEIADSCMNNAQKRGYIRTLLGRRSHFNLWEPAKYDGKVIPMKLEDAQRAWPGKPLRRALTHKALNRLIQGSAADMTKAAMLKLHEEMGIIPYMQVHDELDNPAKDEVEAMKQNKACCEAVNMCVPIKVDTSIGRSWK